MRCTVLWRGDGLTWALWAVVLQDVRVDLLLHQGRALVVLGSVWFPKDWACLTNLYAYGYSIFLEVTSSTFIFTVSWSVNAPAGRICPAAICTTSCILFVKHAPGTWSLTKLKRWLPRAWESRLGRMKHWEGLAWRWVLQKPPLALLPAPVCGAAGGSRDQGVHS